MSYRSVRVGRLLIIRWLRPDETDIERLLAELRDTRAALGDRAPLLVALMPEESEAPSLTTGRAMAARIGDAYAIVDRIYAVLEGSSVLTIAKRLAFDAIMALSEHGQRTVVCRSLDAVIADAGPLLEANRPEIHAAASRLFR